MASVDITWVVEVPKITKYLLNPAHPEGGSKARYFLQFGFRAAEPEILGRTLVAHGSGNPPGRVVYPPFGKARVIFEGPVQAPDGRTMTLRTVWEMEGPNRIRLLTGYPYGR